jgi:mannose-6-phosphate isomerase-like protein (cupin superfamily)
MALHDVIRVVGNGRLLAYIIRSSFQPDATSFLTEPELNQQVGFVVYPSGAEIARHVHKPIERQIVGTSEVLVLRSGRCEVDFYTDERDLVATHELRPGDVCVMVEGGHGFRVREDAVFLEVKQGPYLGVDEKERF